MPQVTRLINQLVPKIDAETLLDVGIGDGETILTIQPHFKDPILFGCDPVDSPRGLGELSNWFEKKPYHESKFFDQEFDVITFMDSLACYNKDEGGKILDHAVEKARKMVLVWTPECYYPYQPFNSGWHVEDFLNRGFCLYKAVNIHQGPPMVANGLLAWKLCV